MDLTSLLHKTFGFTSFRANQEAVCRAATEGRDVLLVMPTGAGKSLCYQLPAIARGGTALVICPLIALMDDQAAKLRPWPPRRTHPLRPLTRRSPPGLPRLPRRRPPVPLHRARAHARPRLPRDAREDEALAHRHRRGSLHLCNGAMTFAPTTVLSATTYPPFAPPQ